jgi:hypothetical protein
LVFPRKHDGQNARRLRRIARVLRAVNVPLDAWPASKSNDFILTAREDVMDARAPIIHSPTTIQSVTATRWRRSP